MDVCIFLSLILHGDACCQKGSHLDAGEGGGG